uniref:(northern house mosquito) hypothetical protein n=1 Tax=Culex pipiens TaxID=7175 RepID=A0A8D8BZU3_CULPI
MRCSMGAALNHRCSAERPAKYLSARKIPDRTLLLLKLRSGMTSAVENVCKAHYRKFWQLYLPATCCDPLDSHPAKLRRHALTTISAEYHDRYHPVCARIVQGMKLCVSCAIRIKKEFANRRRGFKLAEKVAILDRLAAGESVVDVATEYRTTEAAIEDVLNWEWQIRLEAGQVEEMKAELMEAPRELRHRFNAGGAFKMEYGPAGGKIWELERVKNEDDMAEVEPFDGEPLKEDESVMVEECDVEVKIEIEEEPVGVESD